MGSYVCIWPDEKRFVYMALFIIFWGGMNLKLIQPSVIAMGECSISMRTPSALISHMLGKST